MHSFITLAITFGVGIAAAFPIDLSPRSAWQANVGSSWQIILSDVVDASNTVSPNVGIFDVDLFDTDASTISSLKNQGKKVICYFSAGSYEPNRPDSSQFRQNDMGRTLDGWPDEKWLNLKSTNVKNIMAKRVKLAAQKGCNGIDPDNMDGYGNNNGLGLQASDSVNFMKYLAGIAKSSNVAIGLKNSLEIIPSVVGVVQFAVNEQCHQYNECGSYAPFTAAGKPVFNIEYPDSAPSVSVSQRRKLCGATGAAHLSTVMKTMDLNGWVQFCDASTAETATVS
ncbi:glycoside hydrolase family 114 protein [Glonium stellatum]|uniref:alpha-galactosidase n=1 Tax=Glonium stellatum TaxID=574774 RepID=A0A8E2JZE8_9PEZI|nr:glycoside hydrolase family 114 protein [Glonium stellatum]